MRIVKSYSSGGYWARHEGNLKLLNQIKPYGIYILRDGSMPVYVGMGKIHRRLWRHHNQTTKRQAWDHFSWFETNPRIARELEALITRVLPYYLRNLNKQGGKLTGARRVKPVKGNVVAIDHPRISPVLRRGR